MFNSHGQSGDWSNPLPVLPLSVFLPGHRDDGARRRKRDPRGRRTTRGERAAISRALGWWRRTFGRWAQEGTGAAPSVVCGEGVLCTSMPAWVARRYSRRCCCWIPSSRSSPPPQHNLLVSPMCQALRLPPPPVLRSSVDFHLNPRKPAARDQVCRQAEAGVCPVLQRGGGGDGDVRQMAGGAGGPERHAPAGSAAG